MVALLIWSGFIPLSAAVRSSSVFPSSSFSCVFFYFLMNQISETHFQDVPSSDQASGIGVSSTPAASTNHQHATDGARQDDDLPPGYPKLAERMSIAPETAVFRRFGFLNTLNLLYLQAELMDIEDQLKHLQKKDCKKSGCEQYYATDWFYFKDGDHAQAKVMQDAREKLEKYSNAIRANVSMQTIEI